MASDLLAQASSIPSAEQAAVATAQAVEFMDLLAYIYLQHGLAQKAVVLLSARDKLAPNNERTLLCLAQAQLHSAKPSLALQTLERLVVLGVISAEFHLLRAQALQKLERDAEAASAMRAYLAMQTAKSNPPATRP